MNFFMSYYEVNGALLEVVDRTFDILINDQLLIRETLQGTKIPEVVDISYQIPSALLRDLEVDEDGFATILVTFKNTSSESFVGGVLEVRTIKACCYCS